MRNLIVIVLLAGTVGLNAAVSQTIKHPFTITGHFNGVAIGTIQILAESGDTIVSQASIENGEFKISGNIGTARQMLFRCKPGNWHFKAFVEPGNSTLVVDTIGARRYGAAHDEVNSWALIWKVDQCCTPMATDYNNFVVQTNQHIISSQLRVLFTQMQSATKPEEKILCDYLIDSLKEMAFSNQAAWIEHFITAKPRSESGPFLLLQLLQQASELDLSYFKKWSDLFASEARQGYYYQTLQEKLYALGNQQVEHVVPDFSLQKPDNRQFTLSSLRGKYVLLDFWASWCGPCRKEIPGWKALYEEYNKRGLEIVAISGDRHKKDWHKALKAENMPWIQVIDSFPADDKPALVSDLFGIHFLPHYILLNKEGKVLLSTADTNKIKEAIYEYLGKL